MSKRRLGNVRLAFVLLLTPLWTLCLMLCIEAGWRFYIQAHNDSAHRHILTVSDRCRQADDAVFQEVWNRCPPPDTVPWDLPPRDTFAALDEEGRKHLAQIRREVILICDQGGLIEILYPCTQLDELKVISETVHAGDSIGVLLPEEELKDALQAIRQADENSKPVRDYYVPLSNGENYLAEFNVLKVAAKPLFALFLGNSRYETLWCSYRPNIYRHNWYTAQFINSEFWTNSRGVRDGEVRVPKPDGVVRIVCVGASTTVEGPHNELTYPAFLERLLRERLQTDAIEVINCGVDGLTMIRERERIPDWMALDPDLILHYNIVNDIPMIMNKAINNSGINNKWQGAFRKFAAHSAVLTTCLPKLFLPADSFLVAELTAHVNACFVPVIEAVQANGAAFAVASFATPDAREISADERHYFDRSFHTFLLARATTADYNWAIGLYNRTVESFCRENHLFYIPVAENFSGGIDTFTDICHMRLRGIELKATVMAEHLESFVRERLEMEDKNK